mgnify:CR=1 FL=1
MKHKVKKRFFKIKVNDKFVIITEDHSIVVERNGELISVKPSEIKGGDAMISMNTLDTEQYQRVLYENKNNNIKNRISKKEKKI